MESCFPNLNLWPNFKWQLLSIMDFTFLWYELRFTFYIQVLLDITPFELEILDYFEDDEYERKTVDVYLMDTSEKMQVDTYVWCNKSDPNLYGEWDFEEWKRLHKEDFIKMSMGFMEELQLPESKPRVATYESFYQQKDDRTSMA
ncbi:OLC1v1036344C5 [Oldenlandia corymbosa var. corymbosa]|uniref:Putative gamma-glutamylcyclotransferase n=1 Tax=Oldenlandia corymbosa var. corymbosa TaxID=529605 RepID=A0AAV1CYA5_OLDCO|nr:OLC1v1036344C5 [Oldenlandia corymbosa var. corymbosa]